MKHITFLVVFTMLLSLSIYAEIPKVVITHSVGQVMLSYSAALGRRHELWASNSLSPNGWTGPLDTKFGTGASESVGVSTAGHPQRFFQLRISDLAPTPAVFASIVVGDTITGGEYTFTSATRFLWFDEPGNWRYTKTGVNSATIVFTYDADRNNPNVYREEMRLTFTANNSGRYNYLEYDSNSLSILDEGIPFSFQ